MSEAAPALSISLETVGLPPAEAGGPAVGAHDDRSFVGHAKLVGGLTLVSRLAGLAREIVAARYMGDGLVAAAFTFAFTVPNLFRKLFGEGALSAAFVPLYAQAVKKEGTEAANEFAAAGINLLCIVQV